MSDPKRPALVPLPGSIDIPDDVDLQAVVEILRETYPEMDAAEIVEAIAKVLKEQRQ